MPAPEPFSSDIPLAAESRALVPYLEQYFGLWAMREGEFRAGCQLASRLDLHLHLASDRAAQARAGGSSKPVVQGQVAVVGLHGTLMKHVSSMDDGTSTVAARRQIRAAADDPEVSGILLHIDSPGGTVSGTKDLADDIAAAAKRKPVYAYIEDLGASAAYWLASQATKVFAGPTALVGSIGTYGVVYDLSAMAAMQGIKVHVVRAGSFKGAGEPGTPVTHEQLAELQHRVNELNDFFIRGVAEGRRMSLARVRDLADGRVHIAADAAQMGLIDSVQSLDDTFNQLSQASYKRKSTMATAEPVQIAATLAEGAASYHDLVESCIGADEKFICGQLAKKATVAEAQKSWMAEQNSRIAQARSDADAAKAAANKPGVPAIKSQPNAQASDSADPTSDWQAKVAAKVAAGMSRDRAVSAVNRENPGLRTAMLVAHNQAHKRPHAVAELSR